MSYISAATCGMVSGLWPSGLLLLVPKSLSCTQASHGSPSSSLVHACGRLIRETIGATPGEALIDERKQS